MFHRCLMSLCVSLFIAYTFHRCLMFFSVSLLIGSLYVSLLFDELVCFTVV